MCFLIVRRFCLLIESALLNRVCVLLAIGN